MSTQAASKSPTPPPQPHSHQIPVQECNGFTFYANFDSANLGRVEATAPSDHAPPPYTNSAKTAPMCSNDQRVEHEFNIWTRADCAGTEYENGNRTWFYFGVKPSVQGALVRLNIMDINKQTKMFSQGMAPVFRVMPGKGTWERVRDKIHFTTCDNVFSISFRFKTPENPQCVVYFAFTYPYSYSDLQCYLRSLDEKYGNHHALCEDDIYYVREKVCDSLDGRRVDLLTLSSFHGLGSEREPRLQHLFTERCVARPFRFVDKPVIFVSARVHPGETPSTFVFNGFLQLLLTRDDPTAIALRKKYVFKMIPFLNPDGVARGHYRTDTRGINLNRVYLCAARHLHPSVYAARALLLYYHYGFEIPNSSDIYDSSTCSSGATSNSSASNVSPRATLNHHMAPNKVPSDEGHRLVGLERDVVTMVESAMIHGIRRSSNPESVNSKDNNQLLALCLSNRENVTGQLSTSTVLTDVVTGASGAGVVDGGIGGSATVETITTEIGQSTKSGLFLYLDMHGHASKKGIFMYGNHFDDLEQSVECMLLPKIMSLNNHNFHFTACNFTERNMYLKDRRDGMSREGSGRVAVLKLTGLVRSYTLECNYNSGRIVNPLPPTIREGSGKAVSTLPVPPKYNPVVFEEVGKALGLSILDLTGDNPATRIPNSEFHSLHGVRDYLINSAQMDVAITAPPPLLDHQLHPTYQHLYNHNSQQQARIPSLNLAMRSTRPRSRSHSRSRSASIGMGAVSGGPSYCLDITGGGGSGFLTVGTPAVVAAATVAPAATVSGRRRASAASLSTTTHQSIGSQNPFLTNKSRTCEAMVIKTKLGGGGGAKPTSAATGITRSAAAAATVSSTVAKRSRSINVPIDRKENVIGMSTTATVAPGRGVGAVTRGARSGKSGGGGMIGAVNSSGVGRGSVSGAMSEGSGLLVAASVASGRKKSLCCGPQTSNAASNSAKRVTKWSGASTGIMGGAGSGMLRLPLRKSATMGAAVITGGIGAMAPGNVEGGTIETARSNKSSVHAVQMSPRRDNKWQTCGSDADHSAKASPQKVKDSMLASGTEGAANHLREICFVKSPDSGAKTIIAKYNSKPQISDDNLIVTWDAHSSSVYTQKGETMPRYRDPAAGGRRRFVSAPRAQDCSRGSYRGSTKSTSPGPSGRSAPVRRINADAVAVTSDVNTPCVTTSVNSTRNRLKGMRMRSSLRAVPAAMLSGRHSSSTLVGHTTPVLKASSVGTTASVPLPRSSLSPTLMPVVRSSTFRVHNFRNAGQMSTQSSSTGGRHCRRRASQRRMLIRRMTKSTGTNTDINLLGIHPPVAGGRKIEKARAIGKRKKFKG